MPSDCFFSRRQYRTLAKAVAPKSLMVSFLALELSTNRSSGGAFTGEGHGNLRTWQDLRIAMMYSRGLL